MKNRQITQKSYSNAQRGFSLIELLVAMALGIFITAGILQVFLGTRQSSEVIKAQLYMQESGRFAMYFITRVVRQAGYINSGNINDDPISFADEMVSRANSYGAADETIPAAFPETDYFFENTVVAGSNNVSGDFDGVALKTGSDVLSIRLQGDPDNAMVDCAGHSLPLLDDQYVDITFFISDDDQFYCNIKNGGDKGTINTTVALVAGIEDMQVEYGIASGESRSRVGRYVNADEAGEISATDNFGWEAVLAVRIGFLSVSENSPLADGAPEYNLQVLDEARNISDRKVRQVFNRTIVVRNQLWSN